MIMQTHMSPIRPRLMALYKCALIWCDLICKRLAITEYFAAVINCIWSVVWLCVSACMFIVFFFYFFLHCALSLAAQCIAIGPVCVFACNGQAGGRCPNLTAASARAVFASLWALFFHSTSAFVRINVLFNSWTCIAASVLIGLKRFLVFNDYFIYLFFVRSTDFVFFTLNIAP